MGGQIKLLSIHLKISIVGLLNGIRIYLIMKEVRAIGCGSRILY